VRGAKAAGGLVMGISPGLSVDEHRGKYRSPVDGLDVLIYTGSGLMGREITNIRSCDIVGDCRRAHGHARRAREGRLIGVLTGTGGITAVIEAIIRVSAKDTGTCVVYDDDPMKLIERVLHVCGTSHVRKPSCFCDGPVGGG
jgi:hypothetical protein